MKYIDEYQNESTVKQLIILINKTLTRPWKIMEVCGGQTHSIVKFGLDQMLPPSLTLLHGPGCPVCVTPLEIIDAAIELSLRKEVILCSFGDMLRVPGSKSDLLRAKAQGADVRMVYSPLDSIKLAMDNPKKEVVFFAVGFETTAPANALAIIQAKEKNIGNYSMLISHVLVPPAMKALLESPQRQVQAFLAAGHVCTIMGEEEYWPLCREYQVPIVMTGFYPVDILEGIYLCLQELETGQYNVLNQYTRSIRGQGNPHARAILQEVFNVVPRIWRGLGPIPQSGLGLNEKYRTFDAQSRFQIGLDRVQEPTECLSGLILQGILKPPQCPLYGIKCTPMNPYGATMVSSEGACHAYYNYRENRGSA